MPKITVRGGVSDAAALPAEPVVDAAAEPSSPAGDNGLPKRNASKDEWVAAAVARGWDPGAAEARTRDELVAALTALAAGTSGTESGT